MLCTVHKKPCGGSHAAIAKGSVNALYTFSGLAEKTRCKWTELFDMGAYEVCVWVQDRGFEGEGEYCTSKNVYGR